MAVAELPFDVTEGKLAVPFTRPDTVVKAEAIARLRSARRTLATVVAPAGYGKTTLLTRWADVDPRPFAWVALDGRDDDPLVLLRHIAAAIHRVEPVGDEVFAALSDPGGGAGPTPVSRVGGALAALASPLVLVLDDVHALTGTASLDVLAALVDHVPPGSVVALAGRAVPPLPVARWRARGQVEAIGMADLRLDDREAAMLLAEAGPGLGACALADLTARMEGWPAGLYLAALSRQDRVPASAGPGVDDRYIAQYLRLELLSGLPAADLRFLTYTSVLQEMCGGLCDAVLGTTRSAAALEAIERANGFLVPLDRGGGWYRYHRVFGELLRSELERTEPDVVPALNRRAMEWCLAHDMPEAAVAYGHAAGATDAVADLIDALALPLYHAGRIATLEEWLGRFRGAELTRHPGLAVHGAWIRAVTGRAAEAERWLAHVEEATSAHTPRIDLLRAGMMPRGVEPALAHADRALEQLSPASGWIPAARLVRGVALALLGQDGPARDELATVIEHGPAAGAGECVFVAQAQLALLAAKQGAWGEAATRARAAQALVEDTGLGHYATSAIAHVATARVALREARGEDARAALARAHRLRPLLDHGVPWLTIQVGLELTRAHLALGEAGAARTVLTETQRVLDRRPHMGLLVREADELGERVALSGQSRGAWAMSLTGAELRLLPYLATHLTFQEIASRLYISRNTVKSEAISIYRKFGAASRSQAIERAVEVGLLDSSIYPPPGKFTLDG